MSRPGQGLGHGPRTPKRRKHIYKIQVLSPLGLVTLVERLNFQDVIKSAASAASPTAWERPDDGGRWDDGDGRTTDRIGRRARGAPQAVGEAALAADLITA